jgi:NAD(P)-dependent dehydrogenase (short-subunit alcohol dehydrogenase family)
MTKLAIITGGSRGLGKSMALNLARTGRDIIITYHSKKTEAEDVVKEIESVGRKAAALQLDVSQSDSFVDFAGRVRKLLQEQFGRSDFDYLVNNAGTGVFGMFVDTKEEDFTRMFNEHVKAPYFLSQQLVPLLKDGGRILNVSSGLTRVSYPGFSAYIIAKTAVEGVTLCMAKELASRQITVNTIAPGAIATDFAGGAVRDTKELNDQFSNMIALGRVGLPEDIGAAVTAILDDGTGWMTAQRIEVSGGQVI